MLELELEQYLRREYPQENARCEWKEFKNLKNSFCGDEKDDVISYVSAIANMEGGHLMIGVKNLSETNRVCHDTKQRSPVFWRSLLAYKQSKRFG